ncbi:DUF2231 domain-containing protein [Methylotetracoccus oryzae]|uniref:DUF2231 domain-containing protein n=1 Tax=Methylotetracoccus oryzae TaxID=1919059 RepID=UPI00111A234F|nr:DUF2231 domain-containing protein [Methylotetracoccus oryzae]
MNNLIAEWMPGLNAMANVHPVLVHLPIALLFGYVVAAALALVTGRESLRHAAAWMLYFGTLGAAATVVTGLLAAGSVEHDETVHELMEAHERFGLAVLGLAALLSLWNVWVGQRPARWGRVLELVGGLGLLVLVSLGADLGGMMVYGHGVAIVTRSVQPVEDSAETMLPDLPPEDVPAQALPRDAAAPPQPAAAGHGHSHTHTHGHGHTHQHKH